MSLLATVQNVLNRANLNSLASALQKAALGDFLAAFATPIATTCVVTADNTIVLPSTPVHGTLVVCLEAGGPLSQVLAAGNVSTSGFFVDGTTVTVGSGAAPDDVLSVKYVQATLSQATLDENTGLPV